MSFLKIRAALGGLLMLALVGCGGGGGGAGSSVNGSGAGTPVLGGGSTGSATVTVSVSSAVVTAASPATVTVNVRDASGNPIAGTVVSLTTQLGTLGTLSVASVATNSAGSATALLSAASAGLSGADSVVAVANLGTTTVQGSVAFTVAGTSPTIGLSISSTTLRGSTGNVTLTATVKDAAGMAVPNVPVGFASEAGRVVLGAPSAMTDSSGLALVTLAVADPTVTAAESITATATVGTVAVSSTLVVQMLADVPTLTLTASSSSVTATVPATLSILVRDAAAKPVGAGTVVTVSSAFGLTTFDSTSTVTNASGFAQVLVSAKPGASNGADQVVVSATVGKVQVSAQAVMQVSSSASTSIAVTVSPATFGTSSPATVTVTARDASGNPVPGVVVDLSTVRGSVAALSVASVATGSTGSATATLSAISGGTGGADQVVGTAKIGTATLQGSASFTVAGSVATMGLSLSSTTLRASTGAATLSAVLRDATGSPVVNAAVTFGSVGGRVKLSSPSAVTNASGTAQVLVTVADASVTAAETLTATATVGSVGLQSAAVVQLLAATPSITLTASSTNVTVIAPATLSIVVRDAAGQTVGAGTIVNLSSVYGLTALDAATAVTDATGVAQVLLSPKTVGSNGADQIVATATVGGFAVTAQTALQVLATGSTSVSVAVSPGTVTPAIPAAVTVTVRDNKGNGVPGTVVDLSTVKGTLAAFSVASVLTDASGSAKTSLIALNGGASGADQILAVARIGSSSLQGSASFSVSGNTASIALSGVNAAGLPSTTIRNSTGALTLTALVTDSAGKPVPNLQVAFASVGGRARLAAPTAMTDLLGKASVSVAVVDPSVTAADTLTVSATVAGIAVQSALVVQLLPDIPTVSITANPANSVVSATAPSTLAVLIKDGNNNPVGAGTIVSLTSTFGLSAFDSTTASTDAAGIARFVVSPKSAASNGADQIIASASVGGVAVTGQITLQVLSSGSFTVTLGVSSPFITSVSPATVNVLVSDIRGNPIAGAVVDLSTARGTYAGLNVTTVLTDSLGMASARLSALGGGLSGSDQVIGVAKIGAATAQGSVGFSVTGSMATLNLSLATGGGVVTSTLHGSTDGAILTALVKDSAGNAVPNLQVSFASLGGRVSLGAATAMTNGLGLASVTAGSVDPTVTAADTVTASATVAGAAVQSAFVVQLLPAAPTLALNLSAPTADAATPATLSVTVKDGSGNLVGAGTVVTVSSALGLSGFDATTAITNASSVATFKVSPKTATSNGADQIVATATVGGVTVSAQTVLQILNSTTNVVTVALSSGTITAVSPSTVTVTVRDLRGNPVAGAVVDLSTLRGNLASLSVASVATGAAGSATAVLSVAAGAISGADQVIGQIRGGTAATQGSAAFTVLGSAPTLSLTISPSNTLRGSTDLASPKTLAAVVRDVGGNLVPNVQVAFLSLGAKVKLGAPSAKTDGNGLATIPVSVADASVTAADTLSASATVNGLAVQASLVVQLLADTPSMTITAPASTVTATNPATLSILVKDSNGVAVPAGTIITVSSALGLSSFDAVTSSTNGSGVATVTVTPKSASSNGADQILASASVGGVTTTATFVVQVSSSILNAPPVLKTSLSSTSISSASPAAVTATLTDGKGLAVAGEVVTFAVVRGLAKTNVATALTDASGNAVVVLAPASSSTAGADEVTASVTYAGTSLQSTKGFQIQATNVTLTSFVAAGLGAGLPPLSAYGQTTLTLAISGASPGSPVNISVTSSCVTQGKATLSPSSFTATTATVDLQYKDNGCGAVLTSDTLQAAIVGASSAVGLSILIASPAATSLAFISASPEIIYVKGSGFTESSVVTFEVRDGSGNMLPNLPVLLELLTESGGLTMQGATRPSAGATLQLTQSSDAVGRVTARVNSGTQPTPVRVKASLSGNVPVIATVSSNLSVAVGLPAQLNFSLSQKTRNIEGMNIDGTPNVYNIIASDRNGNPVPAGSSINFVTEGGQVEAIKQIQLVSGVARTSAGFVSSDPRPADGRITVTAYALGEESFIDQNGNNAYDPGEPFQDLGRLFKDRLFDGAYDASVDEYIPTNIADLSACLSPGVSGAGATAATTALLAVDASVPSMPASCDGKWSGAGTVYVRRATETVLSTSAARPLWASTVGLDASCRQYNLQVGPQPAQFATFTGVSGADVWYGSGAASLSLFFIVADANTFPAAGPSGTLGRLNPMAAGTTVSASTPTKGLGVTVGGGSPVPSTTEATLAAVGVTFDAGTTAGVVFVTFTSPSGVGTTYAVNVQQTSAGKVSSCP